MKYSCRDFAAFHEEFYTVHLTDLLRENCCYGDRSGPEHPQYTSLHIPLLVFSPLLQPLLLSLYLSSYRTSLDLFVLVYFFLSQPFPLIAFAVCEPHVFYPAFHVSLPPPFFSPHPPLPTLPLHSFFISSSPPPFSNPCV